MGLRNIEIAKEKADWEKNFTKLESIYTLLVSQRKSEKKQL